MKKIISLALAAVLALSLLGGCGKAPANNGSEPEKLKIVTTIFPIYDWAASIIGEKAADAELTMLLDSGVDLHSYQPTVNDIIKIADCDIFIHVGGESDGWVQDALKEATNKDMIVIDLLEELGDAAKEEEIIDGMQEEDHDHDHEGEDHDHEGEDHEHEEHEYDEHVWLSLRNAEKFADIFRKAFAKADPAGADTYAKNAAAYIEKLKALDEKYKSAVKAGSKDTLLFGDRFPFRYLVDDYGLKYFAAFAGCSAETEASFETVSFLAKKVDELGLHAVMTIEGKDHRIAQTIVQNTASKDQQVLTMDSMQATTSKDVKAGASYLSIMESNLQVLSQAIR